VKEAIKNKHFLMATTILLLLSVDFISVYLISDNNIEVYCDCPDFSKHSGLSYNQTFEDEVIISEYFLVQHSQEVLNRFIIPQHLLFKDAYISAVWQPPKVS
jgi:hypothetical protein